MPKSFLHRLVEGGAKVTKQVNETLKQLEKEINDAAEQYKAQAQAQAQAQGSSSGPPYPYGSSLEQHYYEQILRMQAEAADRAQAQAQAPANTHSQAQSANTDGGAYHYDPAAHEYRMRMAQERMDMLGSIGTNRVRVAEVNPISNARYSKPPGISHEEHMSNLRMMLAHNQILRSAENIDRLGNIGSSQPFTYRRTSAYSSFDTLGNI